MAENNDTITVWGGGVIGLTTGLFLLEKGFSVTIIAAEQAQQSVSGVAAAIWFPFKAQPAEKVNAWSLVSYQKYVGLSEIKESGISLVPFTIIEDAAVNPHWINALPNQIRVEKEYKQLDGRNCIAYHTTFPLIETPIYLNYLQRKFIEKGGRFEKKTITEISRFDAGTTVINCLGLGAKQLFGDDEMFPIQGQIVQLAPSDSIRGLSVEIPLDEHKDEHLYIIPRSDCIVVGGSAVLHQHSTVPDAALTERIIKRAASVVPEIANLEILRSVVGLRPGRSSVRLERDKHRPVIHNYGHGGAGYTVSWGCAAEVGNILSGE